ncbi:DUF87 domain-containing protein [Stenotrophomonas maltophilia]|nr:DUF87 domain-containing protein [Stenotrophomonas maltophilia]MDZ5800056.1 DUF87 domain-containing protein [Stenotrophomonas maltophilia]
MRSIIRKDENVGSPGARILMLDIHGEYTKALTDVATIFSATPSQGQEPLFVPYWALEAGELLDFVAGGLSEAHEIAFTDKIAELKEKGLLSQPTLKLPPDSFSRQLHSHPSA